MQAGTLEALREGKLTKSMSTTKEKLSQKRKRTDHGQDSGGILLDIAKKESRQFGQKGESDDEDLSDGGFFER